MAFCGWYSFSIQPVSAKRPLMMKTVLALLVAAFAFVPAAHADCASAAAALAAKRGGEVINVAADGDECQVTIRIPGKNGKPPRVETRKVKG